MNPTAEETAIFEQLIARGTEPMQIDKVTDVVARMDKRGWVKLRSGEHWYVILSEFARRQYIEWKEARNG